MGDAQYLKRGAEDAELAADDVGDPPADAGVDLVEDQPGRRGARWSLGGVVESVARRGGQGLDGEHDARQLAAGHDARKRPEMLAWIRGDEELGGVDPPGAPLR